MHLHYIFILSFSNDDLFRNQIESQHSSTQWDAWLHTCCHLNRWCNSIHVETNVSHLISISSQNPLTIPYRKYLLPIYGMCCKLYKQIKPLPLNVWIQDGRPSSRHKMQRNPDTSSQPHRHSCSYRRICNFNLVCFNMILLARFTKSNVISAIFIHMLKMINYMHFWLTIQT